MRREIVKIAVVIAGLACAANASAACKRETLTKLTDAYVKALTAGNAKLLPLDKKATYGENDQAMDVGAGVLAAPMKIDFTRSFYDTTQCATFTEIVAAEQAHPYVIHTRIEATKNGKKAVKIESLVTDEGDWVFGAKEHLAITKEENWSEIPKDKRDSREVIQASAEAYLNNWGNPDLPVPHGTPCSRLEGRMGTAARNPEGQNCTMGAFPQRLNVTNRRYVIDENYGAISIFHNFPWLDASVPTDPGTQAAHMVRVEGGKNRYLHEVTVCHEAGCGRGGPPGGGARQGGPGARQGGPGGGPRQGGPGGPRQGGPGGPRQGGPGGPAPQGAPGGQ